MHCTIPVPMTRILYMTPAPAWLYSLSISTGMIMSSYHSTGRDHHRDGITITMLEGCTTLFSIHSTLENILHTAVFSMSRLYIPDFGEFFFQSSKQVRIAKQYESKSFILCSNKTRKIVPEWLRTLYLRRFGISIQLSESNIQHQ